LSTIFFFASKRGQKNPAMWLDFFNFRGYPSGGAGIELFQLEMPGLCSGFYQADWGLGGDVSSSDFMMPVIGRE